MGHVVVATGPRALTGLVTSAVSFLTASAKRDIKFTGFLREKNKTKLALQEKFTSSWS